MTYGPCGGVHADGTCEVGGPCPFVTAGPGETLTATSQALAIWGAAHHESVAVAAPTASAKPSALLPASQAVLDQLLDPARPFVVADLPSSSADADADRRLAAALAGSIDAALLGDAPWARVLLPPAVRGWNVQQEGLTAWCGVNCRDRNRAALESEIAGLAAIGVPAMHTVTGDHPALGHRDDVPPVFDLDSTELAALATRTSGLLVSASESPGAPPMTARAARAAAKLSTGAHVLFVNHCAPERFAEFAAELAALLPHPDDPTRPAVPLIACVPLVASHAGAERIANYLHAEPAPALLAALDAPDPTAAAIALAVAHAERLLEIPGVAGIDLSAPAGPGEATAIAHALATAGRELGAGA